MFSSDEENWLRIEVIKGDLIIIPAGIYHRFSLDMNVIFTVFIYFLRN